MFQRPDQHDVMRAKFIADTNEFLTQKLSPFSKQKKPRLDWGKNTDPRAPLPPPSKDNTESE